MEVSSFIGPFGPAALKSHVKPYVRNGHSIKPGLDPGLDSGPWTLDSGLWTLDQLKLKIEKKKFKIEKN